MVYVDFWVAEPEPPFLLLLVDGAEMASPRDGRSPPWAQ